MEEASMRDVWRQKRVQRLIVRLQRKQKDHNKPFSNKILGINMNATTSLILSQKSMANPKEIPEKNRKLTRCTSNPKIVPRETKLSLQRKAMLDPHYKLKKLFENDKSFSGINFHSSEVVPERGKTKPKKFNIPKVIIHSCSSVTDENQKEVRDERLSSFTPLVKGLDSWLKKRGKRFTYFKNLQNIATKELAFLSERKSVEKENIEHTVDPSANFYISEVPEDQISESKLSKQENTEDIKYMLERGVDDLCSIIKMEYPLKECEVWLTTLCSNYPDLTTYPLYWECKALINTRRGIRQERAAIENPQLNVQVNDLINKIKLLNLNTPKNEASVEASNKNRRILSEINVSNLLNSSSIQFSVKKKEKNREDNFLVTPVRRSARKKSCKIHGKNAEINCVSSLMDLSKEILDKMDFEPNLALLNN